MPKIYGERIGIAFDMQGCPNRCRHCWLGPGSNRTLSESDVRWGVFKFRDFVIQKAKLIKALSVATWFREPDFREDYRHLYDLEAELSDVKPNRYELLSIWRLSRDNTYAKWAKSVGPDVCQISFFGMEETNDWFYRRKGAFRDALTATDRLLEAGMKPRWQIFLTTKLLPELNQLLELAETHRLRDRVRELGGEFQIFMHPPGPDHEARNIEKFRPTMDELEAFPETIIESSKKHFNRNTLWHTEETLYAELLQGGNAERDGGELPEMLWFLVCSNWDVFANIGTLEKWWCLGNLKRDTVESIIANFENDKTPGLRTLFYESPADIVKQYGDPKGQKIYLNKGDLFSLYLGEYCRQIWKGR